ncbi:MAG: radical SAM protein [Candidatus Moraniibacteriota bacterium]
MSQYDFLNVLEGIFRDEVDLANTYKGLPEGFFENLKTDPNPGMVQVGLTNVCDLACGQCYHRLLKKKRGYSPIFMKFEILKRIINETATLSGTKALRFLGKGESLLHPNLIDIVSYAKANLEIPIVLISNGVKLNGETTRKLLETGVDVLDISLDANTAKTYGIVRSHPNIFATLTRNVERLIEIRNQEGFGTKIFVSFLVQPENYHEANAFKSRWQKKVDKILWRKYHTYGGKLDCKPIPHKKRIPCAALWSRLNINERGLITRCFVDWDDEHVLADFNDLATTLLKTWQGIEFEHVRQQHLEGKFCGVCKKCEGWTTAHWNISYEKALEMTGEKQ